MEILKFLETHFERNQKIFEISTWTEHLFVSSFNTKKLFRIFRNIFFYLDLLNEISKAFDKKSGVSQMVTFPAQFWLLILNI